MTPSPFQIDEITGDEFRSYLLSKGDNIKWFYWHLNSNLINYNTFKIVQKNVTVGVLCYEKAKIPSVDLYIDKAYRGLGYGKDVVEYLSSHLKKAQFKVNTNNKKSIKFFEYLFSKNIITSKQICDNLAYYYT